MKASEVNIDAFLKAYGICNSCGRKTFKANNDIGHKCNLIQPDKSRCNGVFILMHEIAKTEGLDL